MDWGTWYAPVEYCRKSQLETFLITHNLSATLLCFSLIYGGYLVQKWNISLFAPLISITHVRDSKVDEANLSASTSLVSLVLSTSKRSRMFKQHNKLPSYLHCRPPDLAIRLRSAISCLVLCLQIKLDCFNKLSLVRLK